jgi:outer membrane lipoprotein SlyB
MAIPSIHPLVAVAAIAVTIAAASSTAANYGWLGAPKAASPMVSQIAAAPAAPQAIAPAEPVQTVTAPVAAPSLPALPAAPVSAAAIKRVVKPHPAVQSSTATPNAQTEPVATPLPAPTASVPPPVNPAPVNPSPAVKVQSLPAQVSRDTGTVIDLRTVSQAAQPSGLGAIAGGVIGGVLGNQVGKGNGRTLGAVLGAVGGGYAGHEIERRVRTTARYDMTLRFEDGSTQTFSREQPWNVNVGETVRTPATHAPSQSKALPRPVPQLPSDTTPIDPRA